MVEDDPYYRKYESASEPEYPSTPLDLSPYLFVRPFFNTKPAKAVYTDKCGLFGNSNICMDTYNVTVGVHFFQLLPYSVCPNGTAMLLFNGQFPGPTYHVPQGRMVRAQSPF